MFSRRVPPDLRPNAIARVRESGGEVPFDLTISNPTACGIPYPEDLLRDLASAEGLDYRPDPMGIGSARRAIAADYRRHGLDLDPKGVVLAASSSEAYSLLFKLLCDPGDSLLVPTPSYPLFEHLAALEGLRTVPYPLDPHGAWHPDLSLAGPAALDRARAIVAVHPNNPTGSFLSPAAAAELRLACARHGLALIVDEVFLDYPLAAGEPPRSFAASPGPLSFVLGGLSKSVGLPQLKLSWIVVGGPEDEVAEALHRLEFIADNYLSVATPVQLALPRLLERGAAVRAAILERCRTNLAFLIEASASAPSVTVLEPGGGWSAVLRHPAVKGEEPLALDLLERDGVAAHPGYFFDFPTEGYLVVSLLPEPAVFREGVRRILRRVAVGA